MPALRGINVAIAFCLGAGSRRLIPLGSTHD
jgi:hypothetical protein